MAVLNGRLDPGQKRRPRSPISRRKFICAFALETFARSSPGLTLGNAAGRFEPASLGMDGRTDGQEGPVCFNMAKGWDFASQIHVSRPKSLHRRGRS